MGRWGNELYQSESALDYHLTINGLLEREITFWTAPEQALDDCFCMGQALAVVELMLLFDLNRIGSSTYLSDAAAPERWRETFMRAWDADWQDDYHLEYPYATPDYRRRHRAATAAMFDHLVTVAREWANIAEGLPRPELALPSGYTLPFFSTRRWTNNDGRENVWASKFTHELIRHLRKEIVYMMSPEYRQEALAFDLEEAWVAADILGFVCEAYDLPPGINQRAVRDWHRTTVEVGEQHRQGNGSSWGENEQLYANIARAFDRLEAAAQRHPPGLW